MFQKQLKKKIFYSIFAASAESLVQYCTGFGKTVVMMNKGISQAH